MNQTELYIKNIIKIKNLFLILLLGVLYTQDYTNDRIDKKQKSLNNIDSEINSLEKKLTNEIESLQSSEQKIREIENTLKIERVNLSNSRYEKETKELTIKKANFILDSLNTSLIIVLDNKKTVTSILNGINQEKKVIDYKIKVLNDSITKVNQSLDKTLNELEKVKYLTKILIKETLSVDAPSEIEFILESDTWDAFIINSTIYNLLIHNQKNSFENLILKYDKLNLEFNKDSINKIKLIKQELTQNSKLIDYTEQLNNFNNYLTKLDLLMKEKEEFINKLFLEYEKIGIEFTQSKSQIISLEEELNLISNKTSESLLEQEKIKSQISLKKESRKIIKNEIIKLNQKTQIFEGQPIKKVKGNLRWPMNGNVVTKFGKHTNIDTKVTIDYDLIEIQPILSKDEKIIYLAKKINPNNPNRSLVKKFQSMSMNLKNGDRGFGVFGPQTTKIWKKYSKLKINSELEPIYAIHEGMIESINFVNPIVGVVIIIRHDNNYFSVYNGNIEVSVMKGTKVKSGQKIGAIKKKNILSFQFWENNTPINPEKWLIKK
ncbi:MAG: murein hydrolase activator EnvC family protein [Candidatus Neomarinimicrobiota bacterium]